MSVRALWAAGLFALSCSLSAATPEERRALDEAAKYEGEGRFDEVLRVLEPHAASSDPDVAYMLAYAALNDASVGRSPQEVEAADVRRALAAAERARSLGSLQAFNLLYMIHSDGYGIEPDYEKAVDYLQQGAEGGESGALLNYAVSLYHGTPAINRDVERACPLIMQALKDPNVQALIAHQAGLAQIRGQCGFAADPARGIAMVEMAAKRGMSAAGRDMGLAYDQGLGVAEDQVRALAWFEQAASHGDGESQWRMGMAHVDGRHREKDPVKAVEYFQKAADSGNPDGMASLAVMYASGDGVTQDFARARDLYMLSGKAGNAHAYRGLAVMYLKGEGVEVDAVRASNLYRKALDLGDSADAQLEAAIREALEVQSATRQ